jgi:hypothetical protein
MDKLKWRIFLLNPINPRSCGINKYTLYFYSEPQPHVVAPKTSNATLHVFGDVMTSCTQCYVDLSTLMLNAINCTCGLLLKQTTDDWDGAANRTSALPDCANGPANQPAAYTCARLTALCDDFLFYPDRVKRRAVPKVVTETRESLQSGLYISRVFESWFGHDDVTEFTSSSQVVSLARCDVSKVNFDDFFGLLLNHRICEQLIRSASPAGVGLTYRTTAAVTNTDDGSKNENKYKGTEGVSI